MKNNARSFVIGLVAVLVGTASFSLFRYGGISFFPAFGLEAIVVVGVVLSLSVLTKD